MTGAEKPATSIPSINSLSPRSPHLGRASNRSPKHKSSHNSPQLVGEPPASPKGEVPKIATEDLARMLHGEVSPKTSPAKTHVVTSLSDQLKKKEAAPVPLVTAVPVSPRKSKDAAAQETVQTEK